ncbi:MAG: hypothetical protein J0L70_23760 [Leptolyngbya sp. UWPOB_LEPTO1]|uniref:hypothetical protein n=1 Tax=Leptolyngbya sp. UWPOB_LEPTO1 TaxID=2815653 RepID=UPI001ACF8C6C|nr:hypothetical protein [Leptolyngbya sp. UWPOB_LEPTO1]MBN8563560.1 hypothetical protein [Leptolyngbya sp. UWPOB_LEPTO1]
MKVSEIIKTLAAKGFGDIELIQGQILANIHLDNDAYWLTISPLDGWLRVVLSEAWSGATISDRMYQDLNDALSTLMFVAAVDLAIESEELAMISER